MNKSILSYLVSILALSLHTGCFLNAKIESLQSNPTERSSQISIQEPINTRIENPLAKGARITWDIADDLTSSYKLSLSSSSTPSPQCTGDLVSSSASVSFDFSNLLPDTTYYYRVCSVVGNVVSDGITGSFKTLKYLHLTPVYAGFSNWNDYLINNGSKPYNADGTACTTTPLERINACINGGLYHRVTLSESIDCNRIHVSDALGVFKWQCEKTASETILYSTDVDSHKGLSDLIENNVFKNNSILVKIDGVPTYGSDSEKWWTNVIEDLPSSTVGTTVALTNGGQSSGKIFVVKTTRTNSGGFSINQSKISFVIMKGAKLKEGFGHTTGLVTTPSTSPTSQFLWLEGDFSGNDASLPTIRINSNSGTDASWSRLQNIQISGVVTLGGSSGVLLLSNANNVTVSDFLIYNNRQGISAQNSYYSSLRNGRFQNNSNGSVEYLNYSVLQNIIFSGVEGTNGGIAYPGNSVYTNLSMINNIGNDMKLIWGGYSLIHNYLSLNSGNNYTWRSSAITYSQLMNNDLNIQRPDSAPHRFINNNVVQSTTYCASAAGGSPYDLGIANGTCANTGSSTATLVIPTFDFTKMIVGKVMHDDSANSSDVLGSSLFSAITDFISFENPFRIWGQEGNTFPHSTNSGQCMSGNCRIWDYRLKADTNNIAYNSTEAVTVKNAAFVPGATCPAHLHGNKVSAFTNDTPTTVTFLTHAVEIAGDGWGNDNALCESNEECIYTPNFGAYQGEGDYYHNGTCLFQNGIVANVKLYAYPINGVP